MPAHLLEEAAAGKAAVGAAAAVEEAARLKAAAVDRGVVAEAEETLPLQEAKKEAQVDGISRLAQ